MRIRFLIGRSGVGKTRDCLEAVRAELSRNPEGDPLIFLTPKQATFQIERQLLTEAPLRGFSRLRVLSFERLATWVLEQSGKGLPKLVHGEGRVMVLRALLGSPDADLRIFRGSASSQGFAQQLSGTIGRAKQFGITPETLESAAEKSKDPVTRDKLLDVSWAMRTYTKRLKDQGAEDADDLLKLALAALADPSFHFRAQALWLDGFGELTPVETEFLQRLAGRCGEMTLAFNVADSDGPATWLSPWSIANRTVENLRKALSSSTSKIEICRKEPNRECGRFAANPTLWAIDQKWNWSEDSTPSTTAADAVQILQCPTREVEAIAAAREIRRFVRERGARYRDVAVLVRDLEAYHDVISRVFDRYDIPRFIDRRAPVGHHPLAELTRSAVRIAAFKWQHDDWFGALKTGLVHDDQSRIDLMENHALAFGWTESVWIDGIAQAHDADGSMEVMRQRLVRAFKSFSKRLLGDVSGDALADALQALWSDLSVENKLRDWTTERNEPVHAAFWAQMQEWIADLRFAFGRRALRLKEWVPVIESGLSAQTVGLIPPALDQVLVGAVDRSRNPDLKLCVVLGMNEGVFPAKPTLGSLFNEWEQEWLATVGIQWSGGLQESISREHFYGYIACTRARERLVATYALADAADAVLKPSPFVTRLQQITGIAPTPATEALPLGDCEHAADALRALLPFAEQINELPAAIRDATIGPLAAHLRSWQSVNSEPKLSALVADALYGSELNASVSSMEDFGSCPFRFFANHGLRARERKVFKIDAREQGSFRHHVLCKFHEAVEQQERRWKDLEPQEAAALLREVALREMQTFQHGLLMQSAQARFESEQTIQSLEVYIRVTVRWMREQYPFSPSQVELSFGRNTSRLNWKVTVDDERSIALSGFIDRVDIALADNGISYCVVVDYKSGGEKFDDVLCANGIQVQLPAYMQATVEAPESRAMFGAPLHPVAFFYVPLKTRLGAAGDRRKAKESADAALESALRFSGRFDLSLLDLLAPNQTTHLNCRFKDNREPFSNATAPLDPARFSAVLKGVEQTIASFGKRIYAGECGIAPYKHGARTACKDCRLQKICRFDPWEQPFRELARP